MNGVSYAFEVYNIIKQNGEKWVRDSFDSIKGQSDDIIVIDYSSDDNIEEIVKEYGFRFFRIDKVKGLPYHDAKMWNKAIYEAKYDIFTMLTIDCIWDNNLTKSILKWYNKHDYKKYFLTLSMVFMKDEKFSEKPVFGDLWIYYKPFLSKIRGIDERTYIGEGHERGTHRYSIRIMFEVFNLKKIHIPSNNIHRYHLPRKVKHRTHYHMYTPRILLAFYAPKILNIIKKLFNKLREHIFIFNKLRQFTYSDVIKTLDSNFSTTNLINEINKDFNNGIKKVINSYW